MPAYCMKIIKKQNTLFLLCVLIGGLVFASQLVFADKIMLNNGRHFIGTIKKQTSTDITLDIGGGTLSIPRSNIKSISKKDDVDVSHYRRNPINVLVELDPPSALMDIALAYKKLKTERFAAVQAKKNSREIKRKRTDLLKEYAQVKKRYFSIANKVNSTNPNRNIKTYNHLIHQQNRLVNTAGMIQVKITRSFEAVLPGKKAISRYRLALDEMINQVEIRKSAKVDRASVTQTTLFWSKLDKKLDKLTNEFKSFSIPHRNNKDHMVVKARINGYTDGWFLLDTGASYVTLSPEMAKRLNLNTSTSLSIPLKMADGSIVKGKVVVLNSMRVGGVEAVKVSAVILPASPGQGLDGLLGMSFLREFVINLDASNQTLRLKRFEP